MEAKGQNISQRECYLERYQKEIAPVLRQIDTWIKTEDRNVSPEDLSDALGLTADEVESILGKPLGKKLARSDYLRVMELGTSKACRLYQREVSCGSPLVYTPDQIAYIYDLSHDIVASTCEMLKIKAVTAYTLPQVLSRVY